MVLLSTLLPQPALQCANKILKKPWGHLLIKKLKYFPLLFFSLSDIEKKLTDGGVASREGKWHFGIIRACLRRRAHGEKDRDVSS
jgi:hypothetical protein